MIDQEFIKYIVSALVNKPDKVRVDRIMDERGVLLTLHVDDEDLGRVIGRKGSTAQSLRVLLRALGSKNEAHYNLRIADNRERGTSSGEATSEQSATPAPAVEPTEQKAAFVGAAEPSDFATDDRPQESAPEQPPADSLSDKTKKELDDLNDLDI